VSIAITEVQLAIQDSVHDVSKRASVLATVRALEPGAAPPGDWRAHWPDLATLGLFAMALPERLGGVGAALVDQAAALEQAAEDLVPGPVLPTVLAALVLAGTPAEDAVARLAGGSATAGVALEPGSVVATRTGTGLVVDGTSDLVLGAHPDAYLLLPARAGNGTVWFVLEPGSPVSTVEPVDFSRPLGRVTLDRVAVGATRVLGERPDVTTLAATLLAAEAAGVARWCLRTAVGYAKVREQFGRPIGSFQAVKHLCAEMLCRAEQAGALAWDAARDPSSLSAPAAAALALDAAVDNAKDCVQVLGGIGFTWEHDAHLYLRRAVADRQLAGGGGRWRREVADLALAGARRTLTAEVSGSVPADDTRLAARTFAASLTRLPADERRTRLADSGYLVPHWPMPYGLAASPREQVVIDEELARAGIHRPDLVVGAWAAPTILRHGTVEQQERFVLPTLRGTLRWCQLFSEPGAGSDLASLRTKAVRAPGGWRLAGQKVWTSQAVEADWAICLARTDPAAGKHAGITYFLVDMRSEGITLRPLREITGDARFNEVFLDGVFVPDDCVVGEVNGGWALARTTLADERVALGAGSALGEAVERLLALAGHDVDDGTRERLGALVAQGLSVSLVAHRATLRRLGGRDPGPASSVCKLVGVRHRQDVAEAAVELLGTAGAAAGPEVREFLLARCLSIAGGTTQVLRNVVGERILGLPREKH
jgi:alkylation response protein AidB-like acyl-CoA dehydrogenase